MTRASTHVVSQAAMGTFVVMVVVLGVRAWVLDRDRIGTSGGSGRRLVCLGECGTEGGTALAASVRASHCGDDDTDGEGGEGQ